MKRRREGDIDSECLLLYELPHELVVFILEYVAEGSFRKTLPLRLVSTLFRSIVDDILLKDVSPINILATSNSYCVASYRYLPDRVDFRFTNAYTVWKRIFKALPLHANFYTYDSEALIRATFPDLSGLTSVECTNIVLTALDPFRGIKRVALSHCEGLTNLSALAGAERVCLDCCSGFTIDYIVDVSPLKNVPHVILCAGNYHNIEQLQGVQELELHQLAVKIDLTSLACIPVLRIDSCHNAHSYPATTSAHTLKLTYAYMNAFFPDSFRNLQCLILDSCGRIPPEHMQALQHVPELHWIGAPTTFGSLLHARGFHFDVECESLWCTRSSSGKSTVMVASLEEGNRPTNYQRENDIVSYFSKRYRRTTDPQQLVLDCLSSTEHGILRPGQVRCYDQTVISHIDGLSYMEWYKKQLDTKQETEENDWSHASTRLYSLCDEVHFCAFMTTSSTAPSEDIPTIVYNTEECSKTGFSIVKSFPKMVWTWKVDTLYHSIYVFTS
jgi:hypothetical protein